MSDFAQFMKKNKKVRENTFYPATKSLLDKDGKPLMWEVKPLTTAEDEQIRDSCMKEVPVAGKRGAYRPKFDSSAYGAKLLASSIVCPDLQNAELQDSYGVKTPEALVKEIVDDPGEYQRFWQFVQDFNGFTETSDDKVEEAKN